MRYVHSWAETPRLAPERGPGRTLGARHRGEAIGAVGELESPAGEGGHTWHYRSGGTGQTVHRRGIDSSI